MNALVVSGFSLSVPSETSKASDVATFYSAHSLVTVETITSFFVRVGFPGSSCTSVIVNIGTLDLSGDSFIPVACKL